MLDSQGPTNPPACCAAWLNRGTLLGLLLGALIGAGATVAWLNRRGMFLRV